MNPTLSEKIISREKAKDLSAVRAKWDAEFREDIEAFLPLEAIEKVIIQDLLRARKEDPHEIVKDYAELLKKYRVHEVTGDKYAGSWVSEVFAKEGISYRASELNKSELYLEALPFINSALVELIDSQGPCEGVAAIGTAAGCLGEGYRRSSSKHRRWSLS